jgi:hypothetical protein
MKEIIEVFRMTELSIPVRCKIIIELGYLVNMQYGANITEAIVYELVKQLDPLNQDVETAYYKKSLKK